MPTQGSSSTFGTLTALGGGYGGSDQSRNYPSNGGSGGGGGGGSTYTSGGTANQPGSNSGGFGNAGGKGGSPGNYGGGGGGAGGAGGNGPGGPGLQYAISGVPTWYAAGGAGYYGVGGSGIGGSSGGGAGAANTGSGGGGGTGGNGGAGGSGIIIVSYPQTYQGGTLTLGGTGQTISVNSTSTLDAYGPGGLITVVGSMTGTGGINIKSSSSTGGVVAFATTAKTYSGATTINSGATLAIINSSIPNSNIVLSGGTLQVQATAPDPGSGGTSSLANGDWIHTFNTAGTTSHSYSFATSAPLNASVLLVAGGGGGAAGWGGGGGAGGLIYSPSFSIGSGTTAVTVGGGGAGGYRSGSTYLPGTGSNSTFGALTALGGGSGGNTGGGWTAVSPSAGGSGGGGGAVNPAALRKRRHSGQCRRYRRQPW